MLARTPGMLRLLGLRHPNTMTRGIGSGHELMELARQRRGELVSSCLEMAITFCAVAETEFRWATRADAQSALEKASLVAQSVGRQLNEPGFVPRQSLERLCSRLADLHLRIGQVRSRIQTDQQERQAADAK